MLVLLAARERNKRCCRLLVPGRNAQATEQHSYPVPDEVASQRQPESDAAHLSCNADVSSEHITLQLPGLSDQDALQHDSAATRDSEVQAGTSSAAAASSQQGHLPDRAADQQAGRSPARAVGRQEGQSPAGPAAQQHPQQPNQHMSTAPTSASSSQASMQQQPQDLRAPGPKLDIPQGIQMLLNAQPPAPLLTPSKSAQPPQSHMGWEPAQPGILMLLCALNLMPR